jgi:formylglycine-generating enzyme required for sulfatase activity
MRYAKILVLLLLLISVDVSDIRSQSKVETKKLTYGEDVYANNRNAVVTIIAFDASGDQKGLGSGFFTSSSGELVTNYHVVEDASALLVKLLTGALFPVSGWLASDQEKDFAVLKVQGKELPTVRLGSLNSVRVGQKVFALGSPFGMEQTFTDGMVSSLRDGSEVNMPNLQRVIQHTAPLSPGNSGGPLFNEQGLVIGINTFQSELGQSLNFAIPIDYVKPELGKTDVKPLPVSGGIRIRQKDGMKMVYIPAGPFQMGSNDGGSDEKPVHTVYLDAYYIDAYEVTNAQYRKFVEATGHREPEGYGYVNGNWQNGFKPWRDPNFNNPNQPVVCVSWEDAKAYAEWVGASLPTEAQWEKAVRGGLVGKKFPWGDEFPARELVGNFADESAKKVFPNWSIITGYDDGYAYTAPVGKFAPNGYGLYDMAGNVWEWCLDAYESGYYGRSPERNPVNNNFTNVNSRVVRGGSWLNGNLDYLRCAIRYSIGPTFTYHARGFRCCSR